MSWNKETVGQDIFGVEWKVGQKINELRDLVPNFLWTYGTINDKGEVVNAVS